MLTLFILSYTLGAVVTYGAAFSFCQRSWPSIADEVRCVDMSLTVGFAVIWPIFIFAIITVAGRKPFQSGLKFY